MIAALDNHGNLYLSVMQTNTNQDSFCEYIVQLVQQLDRDRPGWRSNTVWQLDGAKYHQTSQVKCLLEKLSVPAMISGPYSYDGSVAELFFSMFKRGEINIQKLATTKSKSISLAFLIQYYAL